MINMDIDDKTNIKQKKQENIQELWNGHYLRKERR